ncbi:MAG: hypothetical protein ACPG5B_01095 [Chitinophagales bacterium]
MKIIFVKISILLFCFVINGYAQEEAIVFEKRLVDNDLYQNAYNSFVLKNKKNHCEAFYLTTNNGTVKKDRCNYLLVPNKLHKTEVCIFKIVEKDTILLEKRSFNVKKAPLLIAEVGGKYEGKIRKKDLQAQLGVLPNNKYYYIISCQKYHVTKYRILVMRDENVIGTHLNIGAKFDKETTALVQKTKPKDKVYFVDIYTKYPHGEEVKLNALEFEIVE